MATAAATRPRSLTRRLPPSRRVLLEEPAPPWPRGFGPRKQWRTRTQEARRGRVHPYVKLTDDGPDWGVEPGPGDEIGYCMDPNRDDDCLPVAVATLTQTPIEEAPYLRVHERIARGWDVDAIKDLYWTRLARWAESRGLTVWYWPKEELPVPRDRWLGATRVPTAEEAPALEKLMATPRGRERARALLAFGGHALVMRQDEVLFDSFIATRPLHGQRRQEWELADVEYGLTFEGGG